MIFESEITGHLGVALQICTLFVIIGLVCAVYRLCVGPTLADRVISLDMISMLLVVFLVLFSKLSNENAYVYVAIGLALISFLATVAFAHYIERSRGENVDD